jgi:hypothetical protein
MVSKSRQLCPRVGAAEQRQRHAVAKRLRGLSSTASLLTTLKSEYNREHVASPGRTTRGRVEWFDRRQDREQELADAVKVCLGICVLETTAAAKLISRGSILLDFSPQAKTIQRILNRGCIASRHGPR